jgi:hypothetical protein
MSDRRRLLTRSGENITQLIRLAIMHEENLQNEYNNRDREREIERIPRARANRNIEFSTFEIDITDLLERYLDHSNNTFDISSIQHLITTTTYTNIVNPTTSSCPITHEEFVLTDEVIMINQCRHIFKKQALLNWLNRRQTCPCCRSNIR